jgi:hypothetical protein
VEDVHGVDLLEGPALGLVDEEEDNENGEEAAGSTWGPIVWAICGEMYPFKYRAVCMGVATAANWTWTGGVRGGVGVQDLVADGGPDHEADEHPSATVHQCFFIVGFATTWGPIVWAICGEMYPFKYRAVCMGVAGSR